jgi:putative membrane protein
MYSIFIGLTLGGVPIVWKLIGRAEASAWIAAVVGFAGMAVLALYQSDQSGGTADRSGFVFMLIAGIAGASAMILPGISGGYLLLVLGVYVPILGGMDAFKDAVFTFDVGAAADLCMSVVLPVGIGVVVGVVVVSNLLKILLARFEKPTLGALLGLLVGAVVGLWPFQVGVQPEIGDTFKGQVVTKLSLADITADEFSTEVFSPLSTQVFGAIGLIIAGFIVTALIARLGRGKDPVTE